MTFDEYLAPLPAMTASELALARMVWEAAQRAAFEEAAKIAEASPDPHWPKTGIREDIADAIRERAAEIPPRQE